ncbi:MAG: hypothetical protein QOJ49_1556 [Actinomycetota bacterium]|jgi:hypothetical protein|nr:hypothetical protein [Actinomycetota bacterium]
MWALLWFVLVIAAAGLFALLGIRLFRQAKALVRELSAVSDRLAQVSEAVTHMAPPTTSQRPDSR